MEFMTTKTSSQYNNLNDFLIQHNSKTTGNKITHTRIGSEKHSVYGGAYSINPEELPTFYKLYHEHVFVKHKKEYLTEVQLCDDKSPILVDFDFRYDYSVTERQHGPGHIEDIVMLYLEQIKELLVIDTNKPFPIIIMEKPNINRVDEDKITKDGIHMIIGIQMHHTLQVILREKVMKEIGDILELPLTNNWDAVLDEGITQGTTNWQMFGSQKPGYDSYKITYLLSAKLDDENMWSTDSENISKFDTLNQFHLLSAQYDNHIKFEIHPNIAEEYNTKLKSQETKSKTKRKKHKLNIVYEEDDENIGILDIDNADKLNKAVNNFLESLKPNELYLKELHQYTQILPEKYYEPGSHLNSRKVAFALKATDNRMFLSWVMLRSKASDFDYASIPVLFNLWNTAIHKMEEGGVTKASIMYWAKQDVYEEYMKIKKNTINHYIEETIFDAGEWDYAMVLYHLFKDKYVCTSIKYKKWYVFNKHRWEEDKGQRLRLAISKDLFELYSEKQCQLLTEAQKYEPSDEIHEKIQKKIKKIAEICISLKKTNPKDNIMREAMEIFFNGEFTKQVDSNPYLMCFNNGVFDFQNKIFRDGYPQDYITKTTYIDYKPFTQPNEISEEIHTFMKQLFPIPSLCKYMWDHLASVLIGIKKEHAFNIYRGSGSNGKSLLTELMSRALGDYKGTVPITLVTDKRTSIGGATPEIMQLKGIRYAVMQEPSKDVVINEGILKELTGGDPLLGRALYCDNEIFIPQFSLVVCTNALFTVKSNDDGTWRRMKLVDYLAKFVSPGEIHTDDTIYVFEKDKSLKDKLPRWAPMFISMLVKIACETEGEVIDCPEVIEASNKYRQSQDAISGFIIDKIIKVENTYGVNQTSLNNSFKEWYQANNGNGKTPKLSELVEIIIKKFGNPHTKTNKWYNIKIKEDNDDDDLDTLA
jgi:P4 family phage/plasmid primase-like protien